MKRKTAAIRRALLEWFRREARDLPWRRTRDPYAVWISEIILQQTRMDQGLPYFARFMAAFPTVRDLAAASEDHVLKLWEGLGYYTRARNLRNAAKRIVEERAGVLPTTAAEWEELPGIGRYTAGAIASIAFGQPVPALDGNVIRALSRLFNIEDPVDDLKTRARLWELAETLVPREAPGDFNQALMELGARVCTPKRPACPQCPVRSQCDALARGAVEVRPVRTAKKPTPHHEVVVAAIRKNGRYLIAKRPPHGLLGGLWEFPGGKVKPGETHQTALRREVREELGIEVKIRGLIAAVTHAYSHFKVTLNVYRCDHFRGAPKCSTHTDIKWVFPAQFPRYAFPKANHKFLHLLQGASIQHGKAHGKVAANAKRAQNKPRVNSRNPG